MRFFYNLHKKVENTLGGVFERYGKFVSRHPWKTVVFIGIIDLGLGLGVLRLILKTGIDQYVPTDSTASNDEQMVRSLFKVNTSKNYHEQSIPDLGLYGEVIIELSNGGNIMNYSYWTRLQAMKTYVEETEIIDSNGIVYRYPDLCARTNGACAVDGSIFFSTQLINDLHAGNMSYPKYSTSTGQIIFLDRWIGGVETSDGVIVSARALKFRFNLQNENMELSKKWEFAFENKMPMYSNSVFVIKYSYSDSLNVELGKNVKGDISFFSVTITLMIIFSCLALMGCNCVDNRYYLGLAGVLSTGLAIFASFGFVSLCGVEFVDIVGTTPFLILAIGVDDMFILLSGLAHTPSTASIEIRIGKTLRTTGIAVTITSITDIIAFCAGAASVFPTVRNFSWYTGCAILFCYLNYMTFYIGVMTINEQRVSKRLHWTTCCKTRSKEELKEENKSKAMIFCCAGAPRQSPSEVEGPIEKYPKRIFKRFVLFKYAIVPIIIIFGTYLCVTIWGATQFEENLDLRDLVSTDSYFYSNYDADQRLFSQSIFISLNLKSIVDYRLLSTRENINTLLKTVTADKDIENNYYLSWFHSYIDSSYFDNSSVTKFVSGLEIFVASPEGNVFVNDVSIKGNLIVCSRFHVLSSSLTKSGDQADMMVRLRDIVNTSSLQVFVFSPSFIFFEQYVQIFPQTIQTLVISVSAVFLVTAIFMPLPTLIGLVTLSVATIMLGVIGFMYFLGLTLSSVTMINIIMCIGFSVDFSTHVCHAYIQADGNSYRANNDSNQADGNSNQASNYSNQAYDDSDQANNYSNQTNNDSDQANNGSNQANDIRKHRACSAIDLSGGPILNGALSSIVGILMLAFSKSFIFLSFFKVMFTVIVIGTIQALLLLPVVLSMIGPTYISKYEQ